MTIAVHYLSPPSSDILSILQGELVETVTLSYSETGPLPADTRILISGRPNAVHLDQAPGLKSIIIPWSGVPEETRQLLLAQGNITLHNLHHNAEPVAELAAALLLAAAKFIVPFDRDLRQNDWRRRYSPNPSLLLSGKTALILGYGAIGKKVARICKAFGMKVLVVRRRAEDFLDDCADEIREAASLHSLLPRSQILLICLPLTPETDGLIGETELSMLSDRAILVNIGRAQIVDESALFHALKSDQLLAAGLDVWYNYPPDEESRMKTSPSVFPFHELQNVVMSPHRGGATSETNRLRMLALAEMLNSFAEGNGLPNSVDLEAGY